MYYILYIYLMVEGNICVLELNKVPDELQLSCSLRILNYKTY